MLQKPFTGERMGAPPPSRASIRSTEISSLLFLMSQSVTIIGIDPGSRNTGWGVVREVSGVLQLVDCGVIRPPLDGEFASRLGVIFKEMHRVLGRLKPDEASVEQVFTAKNAATALKLGQARGAAIAACAAYDLPVRDYEPTVIKKSLVGVGRADQGAGQFHGRAGARREARLGRGHGRRAGRSDLPFDPPPFRAACPPFRALMPASFLVPLTALEGCSST